MIPYSLKLSNFTSYGSNTPTLDFTKFQMAAISGSNGAGKSSLLDALTWCLWGTSRMGDSSDSLVRLGQTGMEVEFSFQLDDNIYRVKRSRALKSGGMTSLEFYSSSHNLTEGTIKSTQQKIIDTLHLSYETFTNSAFLRQGHADEFTTKGPSDRKRILSDILGLGHYDLLEEKAKEKAKEAQTKIQLLEYQLIEIEAELSQKEERSEKKKIAEENITRIESQIKDLEKILKTKREEKETLNLANEQRIKLEQNYIENKKELDDITNQGKNRKEKIIELKVQLKELEGIEERLKELKTCQLQKEEMGQVKQKRLEIEKQLLEVKGELNLKKQKIEQLKTELEKLQKQLLDVKKTGARCPTCGQEIGKVEKEHVHKELSDQINDLEKQLNIDLKPEEEIEKKLEETLKSLSFDSTKYLEISSKLSTLEKIQAQKDESLKIRATLESEEKVVLEMRTLYLKKVAQVEKFKLEIDKLPDISNKLYQLSHEIDQTEGEIAGVRDKEKEARSTLGQINELISQTTQLEKIQVQKVEEKSKLQKDKAAYEELSLAFGKKGIQAMIIEVALPEIENEANSLLDRLTSGRMKVNFATQKENKSGTLAETLDIIISDEMGERPYEAYSGGEQFRVNLAIRLSLSKLLTHRAGSKLQFLVIDEGFGTQDAEGRTRIVEALDIIKDDYEKIVVITHLDELKEEFPARIEVIKGADGSTFEVVGV